MNYNIKHVCKALSIFGSPKQVMMPSKELIILTMLNSQDADIP